MKLQSYFIFKFSSNRLKRLKYKLNISLNEAIKNSEAVRLSDCMLLRAIRKIRNLPEYTDSLEGKLRQLRNSKKGNNESKIKEIREKIENQLFVEDILYVEFDNATHYKQIVEKGLFINGKKFIRLLSSAGNARKKIAMFVNEEIYEKLNWILECGYDLSYAINPNKFNAYYSLCSSGGYEIDIPRIVIIPDKEVTRTISVDFVSENPNPLKDPIVEQKDIEQVFNLFDGQGIMSRTFSNIIADRLELDYTPSAVVFRGAFTKGMLCTFDFKEFAEVYNVDTIIDIYGKEVNVNDVDVILSLSQFKMAGAYQSTEQYLEECRKRDFKWTLTRPTPKQEKNTTTLNYQYLQVLDLDDTSIDRLTQPTIDYLKNISGLDWMSAVLFLMGDIKEKDLSDKWFSGLDSTVKQLLYKPETINDTYIQNRIRRMLEKKVNEACEGKLLVSGHYGVMISDPFGQAQHAFGQEVTGLLKSREFYSNYWNKKKSDKVASMRSPLTWKSEVNILDLKNSEDMQKWYHYLTSGIIYNCWDDSVLLHAGSDWDFDICCTTDNQEVINGATGGLPVTYERKTAPKQKIKNDDLWKSDVRVFENKIGFLTNCSTTMYAILAKYKKDDLEYKIVENRIKTSCSLQSMVIDWGKGIETMPIPKHWSNWSKWEDFDDPDEITLKKQHNKLLVDHRPYFMIYTYPQKAKLYKRHMEIYDDFSRCHFGIGINELVKQGSDGDSEKEKCISFFNRYNPIIDSPSAMNKICHAVENKIKIKRNKSDFAWSFPDIDKDKLNKMTELYKSWKNEKKDFNNHGVDGYIFVDVSRTYRKLADAISTNSKEIAKLALMVNRRFANTVFIDDVLNLFYVKDIQVPVLSEDGDKLFNGNKYKIVSFSLEE